MIAGGDRAAAHPPVVLREDDPQVAGLLAGGRRIAHRSWGARLRDVDAPLLAGLVAATPGYEIAEVGATEDAAIAALEAEAHADYPGGPATAPQVHDEEALAALRSRGTRFFAALVDGWVVAVTAIRRDGDHAETDFTAVARAHRRRGLAEAVKAASVLVLHGEGTTVFGTGGAEENAASLAMNARLGYEVTERWLTLVGRATPDHDR